MAVQLDHTIVPTRGARQTAHWYAEILGVDPPQHWGPFWQISTANGVAIDFDDAEPDAEIRSMHYAFLITEAEFDAIFQRIVERGVEYYADPFGRQRGKINHRDGGRGVYFEDPNGHWLEILTRPYGSGGD